MFRHAKEQFGMTELKNGKHARHFSDVYHNHLAECAGEAHSMICLWARVPVADLVAIRAGITYTDQARKARGEM